MQRTLVSALACRLNPRWLGARGGGGLQGFAVNRRSLATGEAAALLALQAHPSAPRGLGGETSEVEIWL
ncbi:MAG: hypothetical protein R3F17_16650, partial [Planctomycetota bacterium]